MGPQGVQQGVVPGNRGQGDGGDRVHGEVERRVHHEEDVVRGIGEHVGLGQLPGVPVIRGHDQVAALDRHAPTGAPVPVLLADERDRGADVGPRDRLHRLHRGEVVLPEGDVLPRPLQLLGEGRLVLLGELAQEPRHQGVEQHPIELGVDGERIAPVGGRVGHGRRDVRDHVHQVPEADVHGPVPLHLLGQVDDGGGLPHRVLGRRLGPGALAAVQEVVRSVLVDVHDGSPSLRSPGPSIDSDPQTSRHPSRGDIVQRWLEAGQALPEPGAAPRTVRPSRARGTGAPRPGSPPSSRPR